MAGERVGLITIHSVPATVIRDALKFDGVQGLALQADDIVETYPFANLTRLEMTDGTIIDLGPSSRILLRPQWAGGQAQDGPQVYLLSGWIKVSQPQGMPARRLVLASPHLDLTKVTRNAVARVQGVQVEVFAESGQVSGVFRHESGAGSAVNLEPGAYLARQADGTERVQARPVQAFTQAVPTPFRDTLPSRAVLFEGKQVQAAKGKRIDYVDVESWLNAEPRVRTRFVTRWRALAQDSAFRQGLLSQLARHPEWRPVLYPPAPAAHPSASPKSAVPAMASAASHP